MDEVSIQEQAEGYLLLLEEQVESILRFTARCRVLVRDGVSETVVGMPAREVVAQYGELTAMTANKLVAAADQLTALMRKP